MYIHECVCVYWMCIYIYIYPWKIIKTKFLSIRVWTFFLSVTFFFLPNTAMSGCKPSTYWSIVFLKSWICRTGSDSMSVLSRDSIWGRCWHLLTVVFFQHDVEKYYIVFHYILLVHPNLVGNMAVFVARFGYSIATPNLPQKFFFWRLSEDVRARCCQRIWTTLQNQKTKYTIQQKNIRYRSNP